jgi:hypothetical protein
MVARQSTPQTAASSVASTAVRGVICGTNPQITLSRALAAIVAGSRTLPLFKEGVPEGEGVLVVPCGLQKDKNDKKIIVNFNHYISLFRFTGCVVRHGLMCL